MIIRAAAPDDFESIAALVATAFGRPDEARMVDEARAGGHALVEFVAVEEDEILGHVLFNRMICQPALLIAGLAPLAVSPPRQGQGVGTALAGHGLEACRAVGARGCVVLGAPAYYDRFGFTAAPNTVRSPYAGLPAFQTLEFEPGVFGRPIAIAYPPVFD
ncbi:MAG: GNAT family N-acetyltransferase [Caulobacteraceae bacterium]